jgi:hypothetical protein
MYPSHNPLGGPGYNLRFAGTLMSDGGAYRPSRQQAHARDLRGPRSTRSQQPNALQGTTTVIQPGDPHHYGTRLDRAASRVINHLCRCQNPNGHRDAWAISDDYWRGCFTLDLQGRPLTWKQLSNRVLDYCNKTDITREEELRNYRHIVHPRDCEDILDHHRDLDFHCGIGGHIVLSPYGEEDGVQAFTEDGHVRNNVTSEGLRTVYNPTVQGGQSLQGPSRR